MIEYIDGHENMICTDEFQSLSDFSINDLSKLKMALPKGFGHTFLTAYIAAHYDAAVLYINMEHYEDIKENFKKIIKEDKMTCPSEKKVAGKFVSVFELNNALASRRYDVMNLSKVKEKISKAKVVVVDSASMALLPGIEDFLLNNCRGAIVFLG